MPQADELTTTRQSKSPASDHKYLAFEAPIRDAYSAALALTDWAESNITPHRDHAGFEIVRLNDEQLKVLFYLAYAVQGHAGELSKLFDETHAGAKS